MGARPHRVGVPELLAGLQHDRRDARQRGRAPAAAPERGGQQVLHVRPRPPELPLDEPPATASSVPMVRQARRARVGRLGGRARARRPQLLARQARVRARVADAVERGAVPARPSSSTKTGGAGAFRVRPGSGGAAAGRRGSRAARRSRGERARRGAARLHAQRRRRSPGSAPATCSIVADEELARHRRRRTSRRPAR